MQIPAAMFIESAADDLSKLPDSVRADQLKELASFGDARATQIGASGLSDDFKAGYTLGLQVARTMLAQSAALAIANINPDDLL
jgi:hypothetical protein